MDFSKFYLAVGFIALMAAQLDFTTSSKENNSTETNEKSTTERMKEILSTSQPTTLSITSQNTNATTNKCNECKTRPDDSLIKWLDNKVTLMGGVAVLLFGLLVSNMVLTCCICSLRRHVSKWATSRNGNPTDVSEDRYVVGDAGLPADQAVELTTIYTMPDMPDKTAGEGNAEEAHKAEEATATAANPANGDAQSPEQAEALLPEPPADVAEPPADVAEPPADDVTDVLLVV